MENDGGGDMKGSTIDPTDDATRDRGKGIQDAERAPGVMKGVGAMDTRPGGIGKEAVHQILDNGTATGTVDTREEDEASAKTSGLKPHFLLFRRDCFIDGLGQA